MALVDDVTVVRDEAGSVYGLDLDGRRIGGAYFVAVGDTLTFTHTEVGDEFAGRHLATHLIRVALDDVRARGEHVIARCPFVVAFVQRHPDYLDLLLPGQRAQLEAHPR